MNHAGTVWEIVMGTQGIGWESGSWDGRILLCLCCAWWYEADGSLGMESFWKHRICNPVQSRKSSGFISRP